MIKEDLNNCLKIFLIGFFLFLVFSFVCAIDTETAIPSGGDSELIIGNVGDAENFFFGFANQPPSLTSAILNSSSGTNKSTENLTVYIFGPFDEEDDYIRNITDWRLLNSNLLSNPGFEEDSTCLEVAPTSWFHYAAQASNDCWEVEDGRVYSGSQAFGNSYGCDLYCSDDEGSADVWPDIYVHQNVSVSGISQVTGRVMAYLTGTNNCGTCADDEYCILEDDARIHFYAYDSGDNLLEEYKGEWGGDKGYSGNGWYLFEESWELPSGTTNLTFQIDGGDGGGACRSTDTYDGGNAGLYIDDAELRVASSIAVLNMPFDSQVTVTDSGAVRDYSIWENNGTLGGGNSDYAPTWTSDGKIGGAYEFDGVDDYINITPLNYDDITVSAWFYRDINDSVSADAIFGGWRWNADAQNREGYDLRFYQATPNTLNWIVQTENSTGYVVGRTRSFDLGESQFGTWIHAVGTYDAVTGIQSLYIDGSLKSSSTSNAGNTIVPLTTYSEMKIGDSRVNNGYFNGSIDEVQIFNRSLSAEQVNALYLDGLANHSMETLVSQETSSGNIWQVAVTPNDATNDGTTIFSNSLAIGNTLPTVTLYSPEDGNQTTNRTPLFRWNGSDSDEDSLTYDIRLDVWGSGCTCSDDRPSEATSLSNPNYTVQNYLKCLNDNGCYYNWSVRAHDGVGYGDWSENRTIKINSLIDITLVVDEININSIGRDESNDTTDDSPPPFLLQNDGNCFLNITTNATDLWETASNPTSYYQYKIDNVSGEENSFDSVLSQIDWVDVPDTSSLAIVNLSWDDATDSVEIDLNITVPSEEGSGDKSSLVWFAGSLGE